MSAKIYSTAIVGLESEIIEVEADTSQGLPGIMIVGLPDKAVDESRERVRSAIKNSSLQMPRGKVTINLAPADIRKIGPAYDIPIAISILVATRQLPQSSVGNSIFLGELALDGSIRQVHGVLSACIKAEQAGIEAVYVPSDNQAEARLVPGIKVFPCSTLTELVRHLLQEELIPPAIVEPFTKSTSDDSSGYDMAYIKGQQYVKKALEIAAAGGHNCLLSGPPGTGKTLLAKALSTILPRLSISEALEVTRIYSVAGRLSAQQPLVTQRPFRSPHHSASGVALIGGGAWPRPGEVSLAHRGVLFLDEFTEFPRTVLEHLRQPLEDGSVTISRASGTLHFPAQCMLIAAMNPCPCGYATDTARQCTCSPSSIIKYQKKISGPLLDRIDLHVEVPRVKIDKLTTTFEAESSHSIRQRVELAREVQRKRLARHNCQVNAEMSTHIIKTTCYLDQSSRQLLRKAVQKYHLSARTYFRCIKLSRTIADLEGSVEISAKHVAQALQYRSQGSL